jgi:hypothetical protein
MFLKLEILILYRSDIAIVYFIYFRLYVFSGDVVTMECVEKLIKKDWINPLDNSKLVSSDIIPMQRVSI